MKESTVIVRVDDDTKLEFSRSAISNIVAAAKEDKSESKEDKGADAQADSAAEDAENDQK